MKDKKALIVGVIIAFLALAYWLFKGTVTPTIGETFPDLGREHVQDIAEVKYNSNPPTSGNHFPVWAKKGVYDRVISDGYLIHSLEHGYVVISYNCDYKVSSFQFPVSSVYAHEEEIATESGEATDSAGSRQAASAIPLVHLKSPGGNISWWTPQNPPPPEVGIPDTFRTGDCDRFAEGLSQLLKEAERAILVPRPKLDATVALTAWTRVLKFNPSLQFGLNDDEKKRAKEFIKAYHNKGPEKTME